MWLQTVWHCWVTFTVLLNLSIDDFFFFHSVCSSIDRLYHYLLIHVMDYFQFLVITNKAIQTLVYSFFFFCMDICFHFLGTSTWEWIAGSCKSYTSIFKGNCQTFFQCNCTIFCFHQQSVSVPIPPHYCQWLTCPVILYIAISIGM